MTEQNEPGERERKSDDNPIGRVAHELDLAHACVLSLCVFIGFIIRLIPMIVILVFYCTIPSILYRISGAKEVPGDVFITLFYVAFLVIPAVFIPVDQYIHKGDAKYRTLILVVGGLLAILSIIYLLDGFQ